MNYRFRWRVWGKEAAELVIFWAGRGRKSEGRSSRRYVGGWLVIGLV